MLMNECAHHTSACTPCVLIVQQCYTVSCTSRRCAFTPTPPSELGTTPRHLKEDIGRLTGKVERASSAFTAASLAVEGLGEEALRPHAVLAHLVGLASAAAVADEVPRWVG